MSGVRGRWRSGGCGHGAADAERKTRTRLGINVESSTHSTGNWCSRVPEAPPEAPSLLKAVSGDFT